MFRKRLLGLLIVIMTLSTYFTTAQDEPAISLRDLADRANFHIGAAVYTYHLDSQTHADTLSREFNMLTPENEAKTCELQPELGRFDFRKLDELVAFAEDHDMVVRGHTLMWHQCVPRWLENGPFTRDEAIQALRDHIMTVVGRYKGRIAIWDVANEGVQDDGSGLRETPWQRWIGDDYMDLAFQFAHEADPDARLFYNDYGAEDMNAKSDAIYELAQGMVERGIPIHGVGLQAHMILGSMRPSKIAENMARIGELGLEVQITELDIRFDGEPNASKLGQQADEYALLLNTCLDAPSCTAFVVWGVTDKYTWLRDANLGFYNNPAVEPLLFDDDYQPKGAYFALVEALTKRIEAAGE